MFWEKSSPKFQQRTIFFPGHLWYNIGKCSVEQGMRVTALLNSGIVERLPLRHYK